MKSYSLSTPTLVTNIFSLLCTVFGALTPMTAVGLAFIGFSPSAQALICTTADDKMCKSAVDPQYGGGFSPTVGSGGFGGATGCTATRTPVVFIHGNTDWAYSLAANTYQVPGYSKPPNSVYQELKNAGYKDCEIYGVNYLNSSERGSAAMNYHQESKFDIINGFINQVKSFTGKSQVDIISHSFGVSMSIATLHYYNNWSSVRRFINIAGGLHGLDSCIYTGYSNAYAPTCGSQNVYDGWVFGFFPDSWSPGINPWTADNGAWYSLPAAPAQAPNTSFYTLYAGTKDQIMCSTYSDYSVCGNSPKFRSYTNVKAQINVGAGSDTQQVNWDYTTGWPYNVSGGDTSGVGHFHAKNNTGKIIVNMLTTTCTGTGCASGYTYGPAQ